VLKSKDPVLEAALRKQDELREQLRKIEDFLTTYRRIAIELRLDSVNETETSEPSTGATMPVGGAEEAREEGQTDAAPPKRVRVRDNPKPSVVVAAALEVIREAGRPLTRREIHAALRDRKGLVVRGVDPYKALGTMLWRSGEGQLLQIEGRGYWPANVPAPPPPNIGLLTLADI
jgi:hypothetical protein